MAGDGHHVKSDIWIGPFEKVHLGPVSATPAFRCQPRAHTEHGFALCSQRQNYHDRKHAAH